MPEGHSEIAFRKVVLEHFNLSLGSGLTKLRDKVFRIGHLGDFNDLMLCGTLCGVEMGLALAGVPHKKGGVDAAHGLPRVAAPDEDRRREEACGGAETRVTDNGVTGDVTDTGD